VANITNIILVMSTFSIAILRLIKMSSMIMIAFLLLILLTRDDSWLLLKMLTLYLQLRNCLNSLILVLSSSWRLILNDCTIRLLYSSYLLGLRCTHSTDYLVLRLLLNSLNWNQLVCCSIKVHETYCLITLTSIVCKLRNLLLLIGCTLI